MSRYLPPNMETRALPPRAVELCRATMTVIAAILSICVLVLLISGVVALRTAQPSFGQVPASAVAADDAPVPAGLFFRAGRGDAAIEAPVLASDVTIVVNGLVARVNVRQRFHNPSSRWMEGVYVFPLPDRSAVDRLTMTVGGHRIDGKIMDGKRRARHTTGPLTPASGPVWIIGQSAARQLLGLTVEAANRPRSQTDLAG